MLSRGSESVRLTSISTTPSDILLPPASERARFALMSDRGDAVRDDNDDEDGSNVELRAITSVRKKTASRTGLPSLVFLNGIFTLPHPIAGDPFWGAYFAGLYTLVLLPSVIVNTSRMSEQERLQGGMRGTEALRDDETGLEAVGGWDSVIPSVVVGVGDEEEDKYE